MIDNPTYLVVLGQELQKARRARGWTRKELAAALPVDVSLQTLATYEAGTRQCSVPRLVTLCQALGVEPAALLAEVHRRVFPAPLPAGAALLDVVALLARQAGRSGPLAPLVRWSAARFGGEGPTALYFGPEAVEWLARVCGVSVAELLWRLRPYAPPVDAAGRGITAADSPAGSPVNRGCWLLEETGNA